ncbi:MAG: DegV family protein [Bacilli bacterium]|nr:DegV family protein [Bacilli bacterium]
MNKVLILTDSTCDLTQEIINEYNIKVIPLHINFGEESFDDGVDIKLPELYERVESENVMPKTAASAPGEFIEFLEPYIEEGYDIFYVGIGGKLSTTYNSFQIAAEEFDEGRCYSVDGSNLSTGTGLLILKACKYRDSGMSAKEIKERLERRVPRVKSQFVVKSLDYLHKGGRCSSVVKILGGALRLRPMIVVREGKLKVGKKIIGLMKKAVGVMVDMFAKDLPNIDPEFVFITHTTECEQSVAEIDAKFKELGVYDKVKHVYETEAGCVIGSHCGPGTIGILYLMKDELEEEEFDDDKL